MTNYELNFVIGFYRIKKNLNNSVLRPFFVYLLASSESLGLCLTWSKRATGAEDTAYFFWNFLLTFLDLEM